MSIYKSYRKMCPDYLINDFVTNVIKNVPIRVGYTTIRVTPKNDKITDKSLGYCALTNLSIVCRKGCLVDIVDVVIKSAPKNETLRECIPANILFSREAYFCNTILVELLDFQEEKNIKTENRFLGAPTLIAATLDEGEEALILQNNGDVWTPKYDKWIGELTHKHVVTILEEISRFHALNFGFKKFNTDKYSEFKKELKGGHLTTLENLHTINIIKNNIRESLKFFSDEKVVETLKKFESEVEVFLKNILDESSDTDILVHGDPITSWLFSYQRVEDNNNRLSRAKLTDWQLVKFGSPALDLSLFMLTNCPLDDHAKIQELLKTYHKALEYNLNEFQCDINDFLTFKQLEEQWRKCGKFALALSFFWLKIISLEPNDRPNANDEDISCEQFLEKFTKSPSEEYARKIQEIVAFCIENKLI